MEIKINIPTDVNKIIHTLQNHGYSAYVVGGCVRDSILYRTPKDWDICTSATPEQVMEVFKDKHIIPTGLQHGTVTIMLNGTGYEVTTYRIDGKYSDNRRPDSVEFTDNLVEDLKRRDFTINAMAYNNKDGLIDPFNGFDDLENKLIRCVGSAKDRFSEDALRILRAIRFACQLDFVVSVSTKKEIHKQCESLKNISIERISSEFGKIISSHRCGINLVLFRDVLSIFIPELNFIIGFEQNNPYHIYNVFLHTIYALENCKSDDLIVRLAVFFHDFGKPHSYQDDEDGIRHFKGHGKVSAEITDAIMKRLKFDNETRNNVVELVYYHDATFEVGKKYIKRWLNKIGELQFRRLLEVRKADIKAQNPAYEEKRIEKVNNIEKLLEEILQEKECFSLKDLAVNGKDLMGIGYKSGRQLGAALQGLLDCVIGEEVNNNKEELLKLAKGWL